MITQGHINRLFKYIQNMPRALLDHDATVAIARLKKALQDIEKLETELSRCQRMVAELKLPSRVEPKPRKRHAR